MGLATIDHHSQKEHTEIHKIPKFGVNQASFDSDQKPTFLNSNSIWTSGTLVMSLWLGWSRKHSLC